MPNEIPAEAARAPTVPSQSVDECVEACLECSRVCLESVPHCLEIGRKHADPEHITTLLNSARICQTAAEFLISRSPMHMHVCHACAQVCKQSADDCSLFRSDPEMQRVAEFCRRSYALCKELSAH